jgi:hypothetical protein
MDLEPEFPAEGAKVLDSANSYIDKTAAGGSPPMHGKGTVVVSPISSIC